MNNKTFQNVDVYIGSLPLAIQERLTIIRNAILVAVTNADESISYSMPSYKLNGKTLVYFAAFKKHIGIYATPNGHSAFAKELSI